MAPERTVWPSPPYPGGGPECFRSQVTGQPRVPGPWLARRTVRHHIAILTGRRCRPYEVGELRAPRRVPPREDGLPPVRDPVRGRTRWAGGGGEQVGVLRQHFRRERLERRMSSRTYSLRRGGDHQSRSGCTTIVHARWAGRRLRQWPPGSGWRRGRTVPANSGTGSPGLADHLHRPSAGSWRRCPARSCRRAVR